MAEAGGVVSAKSLEVWVANITVIHMTFQLLPRLKKKKSSLGVTDC
jgi:hypothetical protein